MIIRVFAIRLQAKAVVQVVVPADDSSTPIRQMPQLATTRATIRDRDTTHSARDSTLRRRYREGSTQIARHLASEWHAIHSTRAVTPGAAHEKVKRSQRRHRNNWRVVAMPESSVPTPRNCCATAPSLRMAVNLQVQLLRDLAREKSLGHGLGRTQNQESAMAMQRECVAAARQCFAAHRDYACLPRSQRPARCNDRVSLRLYVQAHRAIASSRCP